MLIPNPTWAMHHLVFEQAGMTKRVDYPYYDPKTNILSFDRMMKTISEAENGSVVLLHACAHNPTGTDPTKEQWQQILKICQEKSLLPFFDLAYQGYATGNFDDDAYAVRLFYKAGIQFLVAQSFAKNAGLYGERIGALHIVCKSPAVAANIKSNVDWLARSSYSNPPIHGGLIMGRILKDPELQKQWESELKDVVARIRLMRETLRSELEALKTPGDWSHITSQIGMFSYTGLTEPQCKRLIEKHHVYLLTSGRISISGINSKNVKHLAECINEVVLNAEVKA